MVLLTITKKLSADQALEEDVEFHLETDDSDDGIDDDSCLISSCYS